MPECIGGFVKTKLLKTNGSKRFVAIPKERLDALDAAIRSKFKSDREQWKVLATVRTCGLRNDEILNMRNDWFSILPDGQIQLRVSATKRP